LDIYFVYLFICLALDLVKTSDDFREFIEGLVVGQGTFGQSTVANRLLKYASSESLLPKTVQIK